MPPNDEEYDAFRDSLRSFVRQRVTRDVIDRCESERTPPRELLREVARQGWLAVGIPEEYGGAQDYVATAILLEELSRGYLALGDLAYRVLVHGARNIIAHGSEQMKRDLLPKILDGDLLFVNGITEPEAGADAASIRTHAVLDGDSLVINGHKIWNTGMGLSDYVICYARTDQSRPRHRGISAILVPTNASGLHMRPLDGVGYRAMPSYEVWYEDVTVPASNVLGEWNAGWGVMMSHLEFERLGMCAIATGCCQNILDEVVGYARTRRQFGAPIGSFQAVSHMVADIQIASYTNRVLTLDYARRLNAGVTTRRDTASLKVHCTESYQKAADLGVQIFGAYGYAVESTVNRHWRDSRLFTIGGGSTQIQKNIIAKSFDLAG
ncbi:acyl-CoA dehydrogenase family protein [Dactylosporangium salmoneum]|uniref:Acyl-CoA dehydrogenase family protein n=1 Tax=Dactylosporangium salmoneum TaxID=53361 RepID=A0ABN3FXJ2_9ACTN